MSSFVLVLVFACFLALVMFGPERCVAGPCSSNLAIDQEGGVHTLPMSRPRSWPESQAPGQRNIRFHPYMTFDNATLHLGVSVDLRDKSLTPTPDILRFISVLAVVSRRLSNHRRASDCVTLWNSDMTDCGDQLVSGEATMCPPVYNSLGYGAKSDRVRVKYYAGYDIDCSRLGTVSEAEIQCRRETNDYCQLHSKAGPFKFNWLGRPVITMKHKINFTADGGHLGLFGRVEGSIGQEIRVEKSGTTSGKKNFARIQIVKNQGPFALSAEAIGGGDCAVRIRDVNDRLRSHQDFVLNCNGQFDHSFSVTITASNEYGTTQIWIAANSTCLAYQEDPVFTGDVIPYCPAQ